METRFGSRYREVRETEGSRNRDSTVLKLLHIHIYYVTHTYILCYIFELRIEMNFRCHDLSVHLLS